jgi:hypothetical protein
MAQVQRRARRNARSKTISKVDLRFHVVNDEVPVAATYQQRSQRAATPATSNADHFSSYSLNNAISLVVKPGTSSQPAGAMGVGRSPGSALTVGGRPYSAVALPCMIRSRWSAGNRLIA